jgi:tetratricopeptide (TPR) repeat protein
VIGKPALWASLMLGAAMAAMGQSRQENLNKCKSPDPDTRIAGCTALIQAGQDTTENLSVIYNNRGSANVSKRAYDRAIQDYDEAIRLSPSIAYNYRERGKAYYDKRDYDRAIQDLNEAIRLSPNDTSALNSRGLAYYYKNDPNRAIQDFNEVIRLSPSDAQTYNNRGNAYDVKDDHDRSIQDFNEAIRLNPKDAHAYNNRGGAFAVKGDDDRAIQDFNEAINLNPNFATAYYGRGLAYNNKGDYARAIQDFNEAIRLQPNFGYAYEKRGEAYLSQSNLTTAIADFEVVISHAPSSNTAVYAALMLHVAMKRQGRDDAHQLTQVAGAADLSKWPGPVLKLDLGQMTAEQLMEVAADPGADRQPLHVCEANYFTGEDALLHQQRATALARFKAARDGCPKGDPEYAAALAELRRLGASAVPAK